MKKTKIINFFKGYKPVKTNSKIYILFYVFILSYIAIKTYTGITMIQKLEEDVKDNVHVNNARLEYLTQKQSNLNQIKKAYELIGANSITKITINNSVVEIEGICQELSILDSIKNESTIAKLSVNSIKREADNYVFNLNYQVGDSDEAK